MHKNGCIAVNAQNVHVCHQAAMVLQSAVQQNDLQWRICYIIAMVSNCGLQRHIH